MARKNTNWNCPPGTGTKFHLFTGALVTRLDPAKLFIGLTGLPGVVGESTMRPPAASGIKFHCKKDDV